MTRLTFLLLYSFFSFCALAQEMEDKQDHYRIENLKACAYDAVELEYSIEDSFYHERKRKDRREFRAYLEKSKSSSRSLPIYTMPVVVHIIHAGAELGSQANPLDESVRSTVEQASTRFRHAHSGAASYANPNYGPDTEIELCMSNVDPEGNYTTGVTRHYDPALAVGTYQEVGSGLNAIVWDKSKYINLFIMTDMTNASGVYLGGFDFTIYNSQGGFWSGLIAHELGHYFSLAHTFKSQGSCVNNDCTQDGDGICDTPPKNNAGFTGADCDINGNSCTTDEDDTSANNPYRSVANGGMGEQDDMRANYMDYSGGCWDAFTIEQKARMRMNITNNRLDINAHSAIACAATIVPSREIAVKSFDINQQNICSVSFTGLINMENLGSQNITSATIKVETNGSLLLSYNWTGNLSPNASTDVALNQPSLILQQGVNLLKVTIENPNGSSDVNAYDNVAFQNVELFYDGNCTEISTCTNFNAGSSNAIPVSTVLNFSGILPEINTNSSGPLVCIKVQGDVSYSQERFNISGENGLSFIYGTTEIVGDCVGFTSEVCFTIPVIDYQNWKSDGTIKITLTPVSSEINPVLCITNEACGRMIVPEPSSCLGTVIMSANSGQGSLRENVTCVGENGTVILDDNQISDTIILATSIVIDKNLTIKSVNGSEVLIKAASSFPVFEIGNGKTVILEGFKLFSSGDHNTPAIVNNGMLLLQDISIIASSQSAGSIENNGDLTVEGLVELIKN